ncbi:hypothetical protein [Amycolatopsis sp. NPDC021455]
MVGLALLAAVYVRFAAVAVRIAQRTARLAPAGSRPREAAAGRVRYWPC